MTYWENSCSFGLRYVSWYKCLIVSLVFSHLGFWSGNLFLIAPFPDLCLLVPFYNELARLAMFYKIQYGLVAVQMPSYFGRPKRITRHSQYNPLGFCQVFARTDNYRCSFYPMTIVEPAPFRNSTFT